MSARVDLQQMSTSEKLRLMEAIWSDLSKEEALIESPAWHGEILAERDRLVASGEEVFIPWDEAKRKLRADLQ